MPGLLQVTGSGRFGGRLRVNRRWIGHRSYLQRDDACLREPHAVVRGALARPGEFLLAFPLGALVREVVGESLELLPQPVGLELRLPQALSLPRGHGVGPVGEPAGNAVEGRARWGVGCEPRGLRCFKNLPALGSSERADKKRSSHHTTQQRASHATSPFVSDMQAAHLHARVPRWTSSRVSNAHHRRTRRSHAAASTAPATEDKDTSTAGKSVVVIGAGWGGLAAAKSLCEAGCSVTLIDAIDDPTGATPMVTKSGKPFEPGTRGFWKDYPNIEAMARELGISEDDAFTEFTPSAFWSPDGLEATAPVFGDSLSLPSPLGQVFATFDNFKRLPLADRASMVGLLYAMLDLNRDEATFEAYDRLTAHELFIRMGLSKRLVDDFIRPTLLVGLFKPPEELSAAVVMELLYYYALAHQDSFDVRWIKTKSIAEVLIAPLCAQLQDTYGLEVIGGTFVKAVDVDEASKRATAVRWVNKKGEEGVIEDVDAVVMALGAKGMKSVVSNSPVLARVAPEFSAAASLGAIDVVAVRLWLDRFVQVEHPANVFSRFEELRGAGGTFFMLDQLQKDSEVELWGGEEPKGSVIASDFYNGTAIACMSDEDIVKLLTEKLLPKAVSGFDGVRAVDFEVRRYPGAVSWFSPGSYPKRPPLETSIHNIVCAGDWVRMGEREHGAKGLCQERAYVCGLEAGNSLLRRGLVAGGAGAGHPVIPIRADEAQVVLGRALNKQFMDAVSPFGLASPWIR